MLTKLEKEFADAMKSVARRADLKTYIEQTPVIYQLLQRAANKYVAGDTRLAAIEVGQKLIDKGYRISIEYIGENTTDVLSCKMALLELQQLIKELVKEHIKARVSFDLSHIGLSVNVQFALKQLLSLAEQAQLADIELFISMEESAKTEAILGIYKRAVVIYPNIGITLQAHLHQTVQHVNSLQSTPSRVRIVKGAYQESEQVALSRSDSLNKRYLQLLERLIEDGHQVSVATHDESIIEEVIRREWTQNQCIEFEMLFGVRPDLSHKLINTGYPTRIYITYGHEWFLYLCHRIAEYPPNLYQAFISIVSDKQVDSIKDYE